MTEGASDAEGRHGEAGQDHAAQELLLAERLMSSDLVEAQRILTTLLEQPKPELALESRARAHGLLAEGQRLLNDLSEMPHSSGDSILRTLLRA